MIISLRTFSLSYLPCFSDYNSTKDLIYFSRRRNTFATKSPAATALKGNCYAELGENEKAAELLLKAAKDADNNTISPTCLLQAGQIFAALGQMDKALDCYKQIKSKYQQSNLYYEIDKYIEAAQ